MNYRRGDLDGKVFTSLNLLPRILTETSISVSLSFFAPAKRVRNYRYLIALFVESSQSTTPRETIWLVRMEGKCIEHVTAQISSAVLNPMSDFVILILHGRGENSALRYRGGTLRVCRMQYYPTTRSRDTKAVFYNRQIRLIHCRDVGEDYATLVSLTNERCHQKSLYGVNWITPER